VDRECEIESPGQAVEKRCSVRVRNSPSRATPQQFETGARKNPSTIAMILDPLAKALGVPVTELLG